jgi:vacuolar-type H+-ATPase subunit H
MSTTKHDKDYKNIGVKATDGDTRKVINQTFDDAKDKARKTIDETHRELPQYMQTITDNQEQTVNAARDVIDNYIESQRDITNSFQNASKIELNSQGNPELVRRRLIAKPCFIF